MHRSKSLATTNALDQRQGRERSARTRAWSRVLTESSCRIIGHAKARIGDAVGFYRAISVHRLDEKRHKP